MSYVRKKRMKGKGERGRKREIEKEKGRESVRERERERFLICHVCISYVDMNRERAKEKSEKRE